MAVGQEFDCADGRAPDAEDGYGIGVEISRGL